MSEHIGYSVYSKRPARGGGYEYASVGSVRAKVGQCENHQAYCQGMAEERGDTEVEYVIAKVSVLSEATVQDTAWFEEARERDEAKAKDAR